LTVTLVAGERRRLVATMSCPTMTARTWKWSSPCQPAPSFGSQSGRLRLVPDPVVKAVRDPQPARVGLVQTKVVLRVLDPAAGAV